MSVLAKVVEPEVQSDEKPNDVLIHVRFTPSGEIFTIDALPDHVEPKVWYEHLLMGAPQYYQVLAGGRGLFRIPLAPYESLLASAGK